MARRKPKSDVKPYKWIAHIQVYFNDQDIAECLSWLDKTKYSFIDVVDRLVQSECGIKFAYSDHYDSYSCTLQPKAKESAYRGYTLGFQHISLERLALICLYIHEVLMDNIAIDLPGDRVTPDW